MWLQLLFITFIFMMWIIYSFQLVTSVLSAKIMTFSNNTSQGMPQFSLKIKMLERHESKWMFFYFCTTHQITGFESKVNISFPCKKNNRIMEHIIWRDIPRIIVFKSSLLRWYLINIFIRDEVLLLRAN